MRFSKVLVAAAAASLIATPTVVAAAGPAVPTTQVMPAPETVDGQPIYGASILLQVGIVVVVGILIWLAIDQLGGSDKPASP